MQISLIAINARYTHSCLALFYLRNILQENLPESHIVLHHLTINDPYYETMLRITADKPTILFFSVYIWNSDYIKRLINDLAQVLPEALMVLGGPQAAHITGKLPARCTVVRGEIEGIDSLFFDDVRHNKLKPEYRAAVASTFLSPYKEDDFNSFLKNRNIYYESSRGCPFGCTYCLSSVEQGVRHKEITIVKQELKTILNHRPKIIRFIDRTFNINAVRALTIWRFLLAQNSDTIFHFEIAPDLFNQEMFAFLKEVAPNRFQFEIGIQSTNQTVLTAVNRKMNLTTAAENILKLVSYDNIHLHLDLILGLPYETIETFKQSFNDIFNLTPHYIQMGLLKILPDTAISRHMTEFGIKCCHHPPYQILVNRWLSHGTISRLYWFSECVEAFYNNRFFRSFFKYIHKIEISPFDFFNQLLIICNNHNFFTLSKTQILMNNILVEWGKNRKDNKLIHELLRFDWLHSGHRFLPPLLNQKELAISAKDFLWQRLPENYPPYFTYKTRSIFFKQAVFAKFSSKLLRETGMNRDKEEGYLCFLPENETGVFKRKKIVLFWKAAR